MTTYNLSGQSVSTSNAIVKRKAWGQGNIWGTGVWGQNKSLTTQETLQAITSQSLTIKRKAWGQGNILGVGAWALEQFAISMQGASNSVLIATGDIKFSVQTEMLPINATTSISSPEVSLLAKEITSSINAISFNSAPRMTRSIAYSTIPSPSFQFLKGIHPVINQDPLSEDVINVNNPYAVTIVISQGMMQINGVGAYDLSQYTIGQLVTLFNGMPNFIAYTLQYGSLSALALLDGMYITPCNIAITTNPIRILAKTIDLQFKKFNDDANEALFQANTRTATGNWLDSLGSFYGVPRQAPEPDVLYSSRMFDCSLGENVNNIAIQQVFADLGYSATVVDTTPYPSFTVTVQMPMSTPNIPVMNSSYFTPLVDMLKAAGVNATIVLQYTLGDDGNGTDSINYVVETTGFTDTVNALDSILPIVSTPPYKWGTGRKWGQGIWS